MKPYQTLLEDAVEEQILQKSRFIGYAKPVSSEETALAFLADIRKKHKDATHNCYAYIIGQNAGIMRYSDDGEPTGTAGMPIIEVMKAKKIVDAIVIVTRYFGGVLLGAGGLVRAYSSTCALCVNSAKVATMFPSLTYCCEVNYNMWDRVQYAMKSLPLRLLSSEFAKTVVFEICFKEQDELTVLREITRVTDGKVETMLIGTDFMPWVEENISD